MTSRRWPADMLRGAFGGVLATVAMSVPMLIARRMRLLDRQPPVEVTEDVLDEVGLPLAGAALEPIAMAAHLGFGAVAGAVFAAMTARIRTPRRIERAGIGYGVAIWAVAYRAVLPALGLVRRSEEVGPARDLIMLVAHVVFGVVLGVASAGAHRAEAVGDRSQSERSSGRISRWAISRKGC